MDIVEYTEEDVKFLKERLEYVREGEPPIQVIRKKPNVVIVLTQSLEDLKEKEPSYNK